MPEQSIKRKAKHDSTRKAWGEPPPPRRCGCISVGQHNKNMFLPFERGSHTRRHQLQRWVPTHQEKIADFYMTADLFSDTAMTHFGVVC